MIGSLTSRPGCGTSIAESGIALPSGATKSFEAIRKLRIMNMNAIFIELPAFERHRADYLNDDGLSQLQSVLMANPEAGEMPDLTSKQRAVLKELIKSELKTRKKSW
jgi:hypothetical protein